MAKYRLHMKSYLQSEDDMVAVLHEADSIITVSAECPPAPHWEPLDEEARLTVKAFKENPERLLPRKIEELPLHSFVAAPGGIGNVPVKSVPVSAEPRKTLTRTNS